MVVEGNFMTLKERIEADQARDQTTTVTQPTHKPCTSCGESFERDDLMTIDGCDGSYCEACYWWQRVGENNSEQL